MFKKLIKSFAASLLLATPIFATPVFAADADGLFKGQGPSGPVQIQLHTNSQGYLTGKFQSTRGIFAVIAKQNGDQLTGWFSAADGQPMQFTGSVKDDGTLTLTCGQSSISLKAVAPARKESAEGKVTNSKPTTDTDQLTNEMRQLANQAAQERAQRLADLTNLERRQRSGQRNAAQTGTGSYGTDSYGSYGAPQSTQLSPSDNYNYTPNNYTPMPQANYNQPNYNQPNDGSDLMARYEHQQAVDDQISLQRSDTMREQNRYVGADGRQYTAPENATQVTVDQGGQATYTTEQAPPAPANETVAQPYSYSSGVTEEAGN